MEERYVLDALRSGWIAPLGPHVDAFEAEIAGRCGVAGALALSSGTAALHLALLDAGAGPGTVVPVSTLTFAASVNAVAYTGAQPVLIDAQESDGNLDVDLVLEAVDTLRGEGAVVPVVVAVDLFGRCADYSRLEPGLAERGVKLVEDAAEALGASHGGRPAGGFGRSAALSFNGNKILTTSGGGMLLSNDEALLARGRYLATQARQPVPWYEHTEVGFNYRMSNILAALGRGQLERLDDMIARRREIRDLYDKHLTGVSGIRVLGRGGTDRDEDDNCWLTTIVVEGPDRDPTEHQTVADSIVGALNTAEIEARHVWKPMHLQPVHRHHRAFLTGASERLFERGVTLPSGVGLTDADVLRVIDAVTAHLEGVR
ncbi:DegT/DnrJ/EryC1/StrS family aminotransferase [Intrasporangium chromatireducens]|uniref:DegT/DnrJ/EryC1/StrS family aminotransferase n=1 Tax=Intrasporangium chromatireducens TaxID=1386088 RepID=UPI0030844939